MTDQTPENTQLFLTAAMPCPYLPGKQERKLFTHLTGRRASSAASPAQRERLPAQPEPDLSAGLRRLRRLPVGAHRRRRVRAHRRATAASCRLNDDIAVEVRPPRATAEQFALFKRYLEARHAGGGMTQMSFVDYEYMVEDTPVQSVLVEYRLRDDPDAAAGRGGADRRDARRASRWSIQFYDPDLAQRGLGNLLILDHIAAGAVGRPELCLSRLLGEGLAEDGLQGPVPAARSAARPLGWCAARLSRPACSS